MMRFKTTFARSGMLRFAVLATAGALLSGCTYDLGLGYASDGYGGGYYDCDPYSAFDNYYDCDNGYGFSNIGYGGGWYDSFYYPGYGIFLFDNYGSRHRMRDHHRRYWGERRHSWYRDNRGRHEGGRRDGRGLNNRGRGYTGNDGLNTIGWPEQDGGRVREGDRNGRSRGDGRRDRNRGWRGGEGNGANAIPAPTPDATRGRSEGRRDGGGWQRAPSASNADRPAAPHPVATPQTETPRATPAQRQGRGNPERVREN